MIAGVRFLPIPLSCASFQRGTDHSDPLAQISPIAPFMQPLYAIGGSGGASMQTPSLRTEQSVGQQLWQANTALNAKACEMSPAFQQRRNAFLDAKRILDDQLTGSAPDPQIRRAYEDAKRLHDEQLLNEDGTLSSEYRALLTRCESLSLELLSIQSGISQGPLA